MALHERADALAHRGRTLKRAFGKNQGEFFAAVAGKQFFLADNGLDDGRQLAQRKVAAQVAVLLINRFEVIDVKKQQRQRSLVPRRPGQLPVEELHEVALVVDFGQGVDDGEAINLLVVLRLDVAAGQEAINAIADAEIVAVAKPLRLGRHVVNEGAVRALHGRPDRAGCGRGDERRNGR